VAFQLLETNLFMYFRISKVLLKMILFFGTRQGKTETKRLKNLACPFCKQIGTLILSEYNNYFHLFWIKLFKISSNSVAECEHCKRVYYKEEFTEEMLTAIEE